MRFDLPITVLRLHELPGDMMNPLLPAHSSCSTEEKTKIDNQNVFSNLLPTLWISTQAGVQILHQVHSRIASKGAFLFDQPDQSADKSSLCWWTRNVKHLEIEFSTVTFIHFLTFIFHSRRMLTIIFTIREGSSWMSLIC